MVQLSADHTTHIKILYWGMAGSGKTTILDILYRLTKNQKKEIKPKGSLTKIATANGSTLYFDRGIFQSRKERKLYYHVYTVAGCSRFFPLRKKVFLGADGVIFVVDSQIQLFDDNIESLNELIQISEGKLLKEIPLVIMLNKQDFPDIIRKEDFKQVLMNQNLWYESKYELSKWNPAIYKTCAIAEQREDIYRSFLECARRINY